MQRACGERLICESEMEEGKQKRKRLKWLMCNQKGAKVQNKA